MLVRGGDSLVEVAKTIEQWAAKIPSLKMRGAVVEGEYLDEESVGGLSKMPTKADMQSRIVGIIQSPGANLAAAILSGGSRIAGCLKAMIEKLEKSEGAKGDAPAEASTAASEAAAETTAAAPPETDAGQAPAPGEAPSVGEAPAEGG
jgi:large subunit ribosomal protein L10